MKKLLPLSALAGALCLSVAMSAPAFAGSVTYYGGTGSSGSGLWASAVFDNSTAGQLQVTLSNIGGDVTQPADVLTALFFDHSGFNLTSGSATLNTGSTVVFSPSVAGLGPDMGPEWAFINDISSTGTAGISSSGFGIFGKDDRFNTSTNYQGPDSPDGLQYGITSAVDNSATGNSAVTGDNALIKNSVVFTLGVADSTTGNPATFDLASLARTLRFQWGTALDEPATGGCIGPTCTPPDPPGAPPPVPLPASLVLLLSGLGGLSGVGFLGRRRRSRAAA